MTDELGAGYGGTEGCSGGGHGGGGGSGQSQQHSGKPNDAYTTPRGYGYSGGFSVFPHIGLYIFAWRFAECMGFHGSVFKVSLLTSVETVMIIIVCIHIYEILIIFENVQILTPCR